MTKTKIHYTTLPYSSSNLTISSSPRYSPSYTSMISSPTFSGFDNRCLTPPLMNVLSPCRRKYCSPSPFTQAMSFITTRCSFRSWCGCLPSSSKTTASPTICKYLQQSGSTRPVSMQVIDHNAAEHWWQMLIRDDGQERGNLLCPVCIFHGYFRQSICFF